MASESTSAPDASARSDLRAVHERAALRFAEHVARVAPDQWHLATPCSDWDVRMLVDHVVRWGAFTPDFLAGRSIAEIDSPFERDLLGDDPASAAARSAHAEVTAFASPGALETLVHHPFGEVPGSYVLYLRTFDNTIHDWDLMQAVGIREPIDAEALAVLWPAAQREREMIRASGHFGPSEIAVPEDADVQTRLLGLLGRQA